MPTDAELRPWSSLSAAERVELQVAFGHEMDRRPQMRTCDLDRKNRFFAEFLASRGVRWVPGED